MSAMVGRLCINEAKIIDANRCEAETKSLRNYQSLLREIESGSSRPRVKSA